MSHSYLASDFLIKGQKESGEGLERRILLIDWLELIQKMQDFFWGINTNALCSFLGYHCAKLHIYELLWPLRYRTIFHCNLQLQIPYRWHTEYIYCTGVAALKFLVRGGHQGLVGRYLKIVILLNVWAMVSYSLGNGIVGHWCVICYFSALAWVRSSLVNEVVVIWSPLLSKR